jgi:hypothetical protein
MELFKHYQAEIDLDTIVECIECLDEHQFDDYVQTVYRLLPKVLAANLDRLSFNTVNAILTLVRDYLDGEEDAVEPLTLALAFVAYYRPHQLEKYL